MNRKQCDKKISKPELLAPAGDLARAKVAINYGADAVYLGGMSFSLRSHASNFTMDDIREACAYAREHGANIHVTVNIIPHNEDFEGLEEYLKELETAGVTAIITASVSIMALAKRVAPKLEVHCSTQMSVTNSQAAEMLVEENNVDRIVLARECSMEEVKAITQVIPVETEAFIHGGMCVNISGRCTLSNRMTLRDANRGGCAQSCRWQYHIYDAGKEISDDETPFTLGSKDMMAAAYIRDLMMAGVSSLKIEGRMKTALYVATVARTYRKAIDDYFESPEKYRENLPWYREQIAKCTYRKFSTGFFFGKPDEDSQIYDNNTYSSDAIFLAIPDREARADINGREVTLTGFEQKNKFSVGDTVEIMRPDGSDVSTKVLSMYHVCDGGRFEKDVEERVEIEEQQCMPAESCPHAGERVWAEFSVAPEAGDILRVTM